MTDLTIIRNPSDVLEIMRSNPRTFIEFEGTIITDQHSRVYGITDDSIRAYLIAAGALVETTYCFTGISGDPECRQVWMIASPPPLPAEITLGLIKVTPQRVYWSTDVHAWCVEAIETDLFDGVMHGTYTKPRYGSKGGKYPWHTRLSWYPQIATERKE